MNGYSCRITFEEQQVSNKVTRVFNIFNEMKRLTDATPKDMPTRMLKMTNEVGELAQAVDIASGNAGTKYRDVEDPIADVLEEAVDVLLVNGSMIIQLMRTHGFTAEQVFDVIEKKMAKWEHVLKLDEVVR